MSRRLRERFVAAGGVRLHVVEAGPPDGPLVVLLHGFPEFWYGWRQQIPALADAGFRVVVPDQRGYNTSDKPRDVAAYDLAQLAADVLALVDDVGQPRAAIVGHDWGAAVGWWLAIHHAERVDRLAVLNVPHPAVMRRHVLTDPRQTLRSSYAFFFQLPWLPEVMLSRGNFAALARAVRGGRAGTCTDEDLGRYRASWAQPGALRAMLNWYRAAVRGSFLLRARAARVHVPTLILWGAQDRFLGRELAAASATLCDDVRLLYYEDATHWVQHDAAASVNARLVGFLRDADAARWRVDRE